MDFQKDSVWRRDENNFPGLGSAIEGANTAVLGVAIVTRLPDVLLFRLTLDLLLLFRHFRNVLTYNEKTYRNSSLCDFN